MTQQVVYTTDSFDQWRSKTNDVSAAVGDTAALTTTDKTSLVAALNELKAAFDAYVTLHP